MLKERLRAQTNPAEVSQRLPRLEDTGQVSVGEYRFQRLALGAMRLLSANTEIEGRTAECFADPVDPEANGALMRAAVSECGIGYIDFARGYGGRPGAGEGWFRKWMEPYPDALLWATKVGYERGPGGTWILNLSPDFLRREISLSLEALGEPIPLCYLTANSTLDVEVRHRPAAIAEAFRPLVESHQRGELRHLGVANVSAEELRQLLEIGPVSIVQNKFTVASLSVPAQREVLDLCQDLGIPFVAWGVFQSDDESPWSPGEKLLQAARELSMSPQDASIALLLQARPNLVVLTGASRAGSLSASVRAANQRLPVEIQRRFQADWEG